MFRSEFLEKIDQAMMRLGYSDRSSLIRDAVYEMLQRKGEKVSPIDKTVPGRKGKGGRPKKELEAVDGTGESPAKRVRA